MKIKFKYKFLLIVGLITFIIYLLAQINKINNEILQENLLKKYNTCLDTINVDTTNYENELTSYLSQYNLSVYYKNLKTNYDYTYNEDKEYYGASTIKILDSLYLYQKAYNNEYDLNAILEDKSSVNLSNSKFINNTNINNMTTKEVIKNLIEVSDNRAHLLLVDNIGKTNYINFAKSLGLKNTITYTDYYTNIDIEDAKIYVENLYSFIENSGKLGMELKNYFMNNYENFIQLPEYNIKAAHKFGYYAEFFHDIGIVYDETPYEIIILTREAKNYENKMHNIALKVYNLHKQIEDEKKLNCKSKVFLD